MKKLFTLFVFLIIFNFCFAQQNEDGIKYQNIKMLILKKNNDKTVRAFPLPVKMKCKFTNGITQQLILETISNDSMIFKKYYNQQNFDCKTSEIKSVTVLETRKIFREARFITAVASSALFGMLASAPFFFINKNITEGEGEIIVAGLLFGFPLAVISSASIITTSDALPFVFKTEKWKWYVK